MTCAHMSNEFILGFTVKRQLSSLDAVSFTSCLESKGVHCTLEPTRGHPARQVKIPCTKVDQDGYEWDEVDSKEHGKLAVSMTTKLWQHKEKLV